MVTYERDDLGRLVRQNEPEGVTIYTYDSALHGFGKLASVNMSTGYYMRVNYDKFSRETEKEYVYDSDNAYLVKMHYDNFGRVSSLTYPNEFKRFNCYNLKGYLSAVSLNDSLCRTYVWRAIDYDVNGKIKSEEYGNGVRNDYAYDESAMVTKMVSMKNLNKLNHLEYTYDIRRNLLKSEDYDFRGMRHTSKYSYDTLDRLVSAAYFETNNDNKQILMNDKKTLRHFD